MRNWAHLYNIMSATMAAAFRHTHTRHIVNFLAAHALTAVNSYVEHPQSRHGTSSAGTAVHSDLDWIFISHSCPMPIVNLQYFDMRRFSTSDHLAIAVDFQVSNPTPKPRFKQLIIPRTWLPEDQGMIANVHAFVTAHSPHQTTAVQLQQVLRKEAETDYVEQRKRDKLTPEELLGLLALPFDNMFGSTRMYIKYFLSSVEQNLSGYRKLRSLLDNLQRSTEFSTSCRISRNRLALYQMVQKRIKHCKLLTLSERSIFCTAEGDKTAFQHAHDAGVREARFAAQAVGDVCGVALEERLRTSYHY